MTWLLGWKCDVDGALGYVGSWLLARLHVVVPLFESIKVVRSESR